jgi:hypothetical protein
MRPAIATTGARIIAAIRTAVKNFFIFSPFCHPAFRVADEGRTQAKYQNANFCDLEKSSDIS